MAKQSYPNATVNEFSVVQFNLNDHLGGRSRLGGGEEILRCLGDWESDRWSLPSFRQSPGRSVRLEESVVVVHVTGKAQESVAPFCPGVCVWRAWYKRKRASALFPEGHPLTELTTQKQRRVCSRSSLLWLTPTRPLGFFSARAPGDLHSGSCHRDRSRRRHRSLLRVRVWCTCPLPPRGTR